MNNWNARDRMYGIKPLAIVFIIVIKSTTNWQHTKQNNAEC
jgi:hypothetical protein